jgi:subtilase family serine protease
MRAIIRIWLVTALALIATTPLTAIREQQPSAPNRALPDFDIRESRAPQAPSPGALAETRRAAATPGGPRVRLHPFTGAVRVLEKPGLRISRTVSAGALRTIAASLADRLGLEPADLATLRIARDYVSRSNNVRHVSFDQVVDGLPVLDAVVTIHIDSSGELISVTSSAGRTVGRRRAPQVTPEQAVGTAAFDVRPDRPFSAVRVGAASDAAGTLRFARGPFVEDVTASLEWFPMDGGLRLAWHVTIEPGPEELYDVFVDAETAALLVRSNRVRYANGLGRVMQSAAMNALDPRRLDPAPIGQAGGCPPPSNYLVRSLTAPFRDPATVLSNSGRLSGNNAHMFLHDSSTEAGMGTYDGTQWIFDFPFNSDDSAATALFFEMNFAHDFFYALGFDEASGNFQLDNFNRGGVAGDPVKGRVRADGRNNAYYVHAPDGSSPTINMFLFDGSGCWEQDVDNDGAQDLDGIYDFDILLHEFHHGVSLRLNTAFSGPEAGAMGEGGGDFFAYSVNNNTLLAEYAWPGGIRQVNAKTYADWYCGTQFFCEVHNNGEIWANTLWDVRERFRIDHVGGSEASGVNEVHQLYVDALKLSPPAPTMLDMRDAILQDDGLRNPAGARSANFCRLWEAFAGRGMGVAALDTKDAGFNSVVADFSVPDGCVAAPSLPTVSVVASAPTAYEAGSAPGSFTITRSVVSSEPMTVQFALSGTALNGTDYQATGAFATIPAGAASVVVPIVPVDDTLVESNETIQLRLRSGGPYIVYAPSTATVTIVSDDVAPDLVVSGLTVPSWGAAGAPIQVTDTTVSQGTGPAPASTTSFYLSSNPVLDASDPQIGTRPVPALGVGASSMVTSSLTLPDPLPPGSYTIFAKADGAEAVAESNEFNNTRLAFIQIGPDLTVSGLSAPATAGPGTTIVVSDTTTNQGQATAAASMTRFYLSSDFTLDAGDALLQSRAVPALAGQASSAGSTAVTIPASTADGSYYLITKADGADAVAESNETNNTRSVLLRIGPDLVVASMTAPARAASGAAISVTETTQNAGTGAAGASVTAFYLSTNALLDGGDTRLTDRPVDPLPAGASSLRTTTVTLPSVAAGTWYLIAAADDARTVTETLETNNTRVATLLIGPDLTITSVSLPFTVTAGAAVTISDTVKNSGAADAVPSVIRFYLSTNAQLDGSDQALGERQVWMLAAGLSSTGTTSVTIPAGISGTWYVIAVADVTGVVAEASETNNQFLRVVQINP